MSHEFFEKETIVCGLCVKLYSLDNGAGAPTHSTVGESKRPARISGASGSGRFASRASSITGLEVGRSARRAESPDALMFRLKKSAVAR
jgi:hypothetical protein